MIDKLELILELDRKRDNTIDLITQSVPSDNTPRSTSLRGVRTTLHIFDVNGS